MKHTRPTLKSCLAPDRNALLDVQVPQSRMTAEALYLQVQTLSGSAAPDISNFTTIWSEEFDRKFQLANHVSLIAGQNCGNDRYSIAMTIATRLNSSTYLACDKLGKRVIIKELVAPVNTELNESSKLLEQFLREAALLAKLDHPSIVKVNDFFVENDRHYLVMNCVPGMNLREHVRLNGKLDTLATIKIAEKLSTVLRYLHEQDPPIIHRDFTPDNIVFSEATVELTLVDFGSANLYSTPGTATIVGKQNYMPPEQFKGKATSASDIYALGSTLCYLLTGADPPGMARVPQLSATNDAFAALIASTMCYEQESRPTAQGFQESLREIEKQV